jgi:serine/threonine protein kinase
VATERAGKDVDRLPNATLQRVEQLYRDALERPTEERSAFLDSACAGDELLRQEVEALLECEVRAHAFMETSALSTHAEDPAHLLKRVCGMEQARIPGELVGRTFGVYQLKALIAVGGMGEVYNAVDQRLNRTVIIKTLPAHLSEDPERRERFKREAKIISELNHPHICMLYDIGRQDAVDYLVLEYIEGETLQSRLDQRRLSFADALEYAIQIADALRAAHRRGIIHRDLKPANVMLTSTGVKLLDFGVAVRSAPSIGGLEPVSPSDLKQLTLDGAIIGTPQYISPEQLEGKPADRRTDIFAFGAVAYEMFTGRPAFAADSAVGLMSAILKDEPQPISELAPGIPGVLARSIQRCLAKNPDDRWQTADDLLFQLRSVATSPDSADVHPTRRRSSRSVERLLWAAAVVVVIVVATIFIGRSSRVSIASAPQAPPTRFALTPPPGGAFYSGFDVSFALSPDGRNIVFVNQEKDGSKQLWLRSLYSGSEHALTGSEGASTPFWSPDGEWVGFFAANALKKLRPSSGVVQNVVNSVQPYGGATWSANGVILFPDALHGLSRVLAAGGAVTQVSSGSISKVWPQFLRDGEHFIYASASPAAIWLGSLQDPTHRELMRFAVRISAIAYVPGFILYVQDSVLYARPFSEKTLEFTGEAAKIIDHVPVTPTGRAPFSVSANGVLAFREYPIAPVADLRWVSLSARDQTIAVPAAQYLGMTLSPDATRVIFSRIDQTGGADLWERDLAAGTERRMTFDGSAFTPQWSPDGTRVAFTGTAEAPPPKLFVKEVATGSTARRASPSNDKPNWAASWSGDHVIVSVRITAGTGRDLWIQDLQSGTESPLLVNTVHQEYEPKISPDGRWIAYTTDAAGKDEVWVASFPSGDVRRRVSAGNGNSPQWNGERKELFYVADEANLIAVPFSSDEGGFSTGAPRVVMPVKDIVEPDRLRFPTADRYSVDAAGKRLLIARRAIPTNAPPIEVVVNWPQLMQQR